MNCRRTSTSSESGMTLVEVLAVVVILGLLASILAISWLSSMLTFVSGCPIASDRKNASSSSAATVLPSKSTAIVAPLSPGSWTRMRSAGLPSN